MTVDEVLPSPSAEELLEASRRLAQFSLQEVDENQISEEFLAILSELFPQRFIALRLRRQRGAGPNLVYGDRDILRHGLQECELRLKRETIAAARLKSAVAASAWLRVSSRWDSPFRGVACGFALVLAVSGELYGVLDIGYPLGIDGANPIRAQDLAKVEVLANHVASLLRGLRLSRETRQLRNYQARVVEHASVLILSVDSEWRVRVCNAELCKLLGAKSQDLLGRDLRDGFPTANSQRLQELFEQGMRGSDSALGEVRLVTADKREVPVVWRVSCVRYQGRTEAVIGVGQDQSALSDLQGQLVQAEKMSSMGQLAAGVVHELNNPLTSISVYSQFLVEKAERELGSDTQKQVFIDTKDVAKLRKIRDGASRIKNFTQDLIQYARPSHGTAESTSLNKVVIQAIGFCEHLFKGDGVQLKRDMLDSLPMVRVVPGQIEQVVINLVTNAVHACSEALGTPEARSSGVVEVSTRVEGDRVVLAVRDSGKGIALEEQARIFEPFFTTKPNGEGNGLGLCIVRNIMVSNHGELQLRSSPGEGTEFQCLLPMVNDNDLL